MEIVYFTTKSFIRHEDNVIDFEEYRAKLAAQQALPEEPEEPSAPETAHPSTARTGRRCSLSQLRDYLDLAASGAMLMVAVITAIIIL